MKSVSQYSLLLVIISACVLSYCSKAPTTFERENPNDPNNPVFDIPSPKALQTQVEPGKILRISWTDSTNFIDGYVLSKSLDGTTFEVMDTLDVTSRSYKDITGRITKNTTYSLHSFRTIKNGTNDSKLIKTGISFEDISIDSYSASADTSIFTVSWKFDTTWPFIVVASSPIDTLYNQETSFNHQFEHTFSEYYLSFTTFLNQESLDSHDVYGEKLIYPYGALDIDLGPVITSAQVADESKVILKWSDNSGFEDGFEILRSRDSYTPTTVIATLPPNATSYEDTSEPFSNGNSDLTGTNAIFSTNYSIRAIKGHSKSNSSKAARLTLRTNTPTLSIKEENADFVKIGWTRSSNAHNYILERSTDYRRFRAYKTFDKDTFEYSITDSDEHKSYLLRIRTITSHPSNTVSIYFRN